MDASISTADGALAKELRARALSFALGELRNAAAVAASVIYDAWHTARRDNAAASRVQMNALFAAAGGLTRWLAAIEALEKGHLPAEGAPHGLSDLKAIIDAIEALPEDDCEQRRLRLVPMEV